MKKTALGLFVLSLGPCILFPLAANAAITFDAFSTVKTFSALSTVSSSITVGSGNNQLLVLTFSENSPIGPTSVTIDGNAITRLATSTANAPASGNSVLMYYTTGLSQGLHNASVTWAANKSGNLELSSYFGVAQTNTVDATSSSQSNPGNVANSSSTITTATANDIIVDATGKTKSDSVSSVINGNQVLIISNQGVNGQFGDSSYMLTTSTNTYKTGYNYASNTTSTQVDAAFKPANGDVAPPTPNPMAFSSGGPSAASISSISMSATSSASDTTPPINYLFIFTPCASNGGTGGTSSGWQTATSYTNSSLQVNECYAYEIQAEDSVMPPNVGAASASSSVYTFANVPGAPSLSSPSTSTLTFSNNANGNPSSNPTTLFAVQVTSTAPTDNNWNGDWVTSTGASSSAPVWLSNTQITNLVVNNLQSNTAYTFTVQAENGNSIKTAQGPTGQGTTSGVQNNPPSPPSLDSPSSGSINMSTSPTFQITATDPESDHLQYKIILYSDGGCTMPLATYDESSSQTGWSGQNATTTSPGDSYLSGTQGTYTVQSVLAQSTQYSWTASAKDPAGSNTWTASPSCSNFTTTSGNWITDSGNWSINVANHTQLIVSPPNGSYVQIHLANQNQTSGVIDVQVEAGNSGNGYATPVMLATAGNISRYELANLSFKPDFFSISKIVSGVNTTLASVSFNASANHFYELRGYLTSPSLKAWVNGGSTLTANDSSLSSGFIGLGAYDHNNYTFDDFAFYTTTTLTMNNLPVGGSWAALEHSGSRVLGCQTGNTLNLSIYSGQVPIDYDNGGGKVSVWTNGTCNGSASALYPPTGFASDIFGGDVYTYNISQASSTPTGAQSAVITVNGAGLVSY